MPCTIIAEAGVNHDGKLDKALKLCDAAKEAGADIVKFQTYQIHKLMRSESPDFMKLGNLSLPWWNFENIAKHCERIGIEFCSTPDDVDSLKFLVQVCGMKRIKIGSGSLLYEPLVDAAFDTRLPVLLSTGMATQHEISGVIWRAQSRSGYSHERVTLMHCVSLYPCPTHLANIRAIKALQSEFLGVGDRNIGGAVGIGYSDHTIGIAAAQAAVVLGATVIEKHFTLDPKAPGPDHAMSLYADALPFFVDCIRKTEAALGDGRKEPSPEEAAMIPRIRKDADGFQPGI